MSPCLTPLLMTADLLPSYLSSTLSEERLATQTVIARHDSAEVISWRAMDLPRGFYSLDFAQDSSGPRYLKIFTLGNVCPAAVVVAAD
jgi:hypothetical protein